MKRLVVIGSGPGGYVAAIRAAQLGCHVTLIEKENLGGVCLNWGCIPTKSLLTAAETYALMGRLDTFGIKAKNISFDLGVMVDQSRSTAQKLSQGVSYLLQKNKVTVLKGFGQLMASSKGCHQVRVKGVDTKKPESVLEADAVIIATGARPFLLDGVDVDGKRVWTSKEAMLQRTPPKSLLVVGSGAIGLEFASFYSHLGSHVSVVELQDRLLPAADPFISSELLNAFKRRNIASYFNHRVVSSKVGSRSVALTLDNGKVLEAEALLLAVGIKPNVEDIGLEDARVECVKGFVKVDSVCQTSVPGIYAIGDVTEGPWLAHKASHEGMIAAEHIVGKTVSGLLRDHIPACVYSTPQIASIGLTEPEAKAKGYTLKVGVFPFEANGKALAMHAGKGAVKTLFDAKTGALLGAHMIGAGVTELISNFALAKVCEATEAELIHTIFPHPTLSEMVHESVLQAFDRGIHF